MLRYPPRASNEEVSRRNQRQRRKHIEQRFDRAAERLGAALVAQLGAELLLHEADGHPDVGAVQRLAHRRHLAGDRQAILAVLDHALDAAQLALGAAQSVQQVGAGFLVVQDGHGTGRPDVGVVAAPGDILSLVERARSEGKRAALAGEGAPVEWARGLKDLETRLNAALRITLDEPDEALLRAVIAKLFADRQLRAAPSVVDYAVRHLPKTFAAGQAFVGALDAASIEKGAPIGLKLAREVVANLSEAASDA